MITTRRIHLDEYKAYKKIRTESLKEAPYAFSTKYSDVRKRTDKEWIDQANSLAIGREKAGFFIMDNRKIIGLCAIYLEDDRLTEGELVQAWIQPDYRGKEISEKLIECAIVWAKENKIERIRAIVYYYNERAIKFFEKCGFKRSEENEIEKIKLYYEL